MFEALYPYPEDRLQLRLHRARSVILTPEEMVEIRAAQRTFEGAYMRTALSQFSFALVVLKIFNSDFYPIGALFAVYGAAVMLVAVYRRYEGNRQFFSTEEEIKEELSPHGEPDADHAAAIATGRAVDPDRPLLVRTHTYSRHVVKKFRTSGNSVTLLTILSLAAYVSLIALLWDLHD